MSRKALRVQIQLDLQAVTCPGVWLCPNGKVSLQMYMLDSCIQTTALPPVFPLLYHEQFIFYKTFYAAHTLIDLQRYIDQDFLYAELVQWQNDDVGNVIASFQTSLHEVLYPSSLEGTLSGVDVDLLMEPSKNFPGIISPKIEISTRTTVEQVVCGSEHKRPDNYVINPKTIPSDYLPNHLKRRSKLPRQKRVCHSVEYYNKQLVPPRKSEHARPPFLYRKADEDLLSRRPQGNEGLPQKHKCRCFDSKKYHSMKRNSEKLINFYNYERGEVVSSKNKHKDPCSCESNHTDESCPLCTKYSSYFDSGRTTKQNYYNVKSGDAFVYKVNEIIPLREEPSKKSCKCSNYSHKTQKSSPFCDSNDAKETNRCNCLQCQKPSTAKQIHNRLKQTLRCTDNCYEEGEILTSGSFSACCSPSFRKCGQGFYKNLDTVD